MTNGFAFTYNSAGSTFSLAGSVGVSVKGIAGLSVTFGRSVAAGVFSPGLKIASGSLQTLAMTINTNIMIGPVTFMTNGLAFTYDPVGSQFSLAGSVGVQVSGIAGLSVTFGKSVGPNSFTPGLIISNGSLQTLDMTINSNITIGNFGFMTTGLAFTYNPVGSQFTLAGTVGVSVTGIAGLSVTFGQAVLNKAGSIVSFMPGLILSNGSLVSLNLSVTASFTVSGVSFSAMNLALDYNPSTSTWKLSGGAGVTVGGIASLAVQFGHAVDSLHPTATPGLIISSGSLVQLNMFINTGFNIAPGGNNIASFNGELQFTYVSATKAFTMSGFVRTTVLSLATFNAEFGSYVNNSLVAPGLAITNGSLTSLYLTVNASVGISGFNFAVNNMAFQYTSSNSKFTLTGSASINLPVVGSATVNFGSNGTQGLVVQNGSLQALNIAVVGNLNFGGATFVATGSGIGLKYTNGGFSVYGSAMLTVGSTKIPLNLGAQGDALNFLNGALQPVSITVSSRLHARRLERFGHPEPRLPTRDGHDSRQAHRDWYGHGVHFGPERDGESWRSPQQRRYLFHEHLQRAGHVRDL